MNRAVTTKSNKRNANSHKAEATKRLKATEGTGQRLKLSRSQSLLADVKAVSSTVNRRTEDTQEAHHKYGSKSVLFEPNEGDSDKENWAPGTQQRSPPRRRPVNSSQSQRRVLEESRRNSSSLGASMSQERDYLRKLSSLKTTGSSTNSSMSEKENAEPEAIDGATFECGKTPPREADDLDCVQNLLSLSQAAWQ